MNPSAQGPTLIAAELPQPQPAAGKVLIRVRAAGVTPTELGWYPTTHAKDGTPRNGAVPGHEFSGEIAALGENASGFEVGQEVYGLNDWFADGATAEFCVTRSASIAPKPATLTHEAGCRENEDFRRACGSAGGSVERLQRRHCKDGQTRESGGGDHALT